MILSPETLYIGDNGRTFCGKHAGHSARYSGRDVSGQPVYEVTATDRIESAATGHLIRCRRCTEDQATKEVTS